MSIKISNDTMVMGEHISMRVLTEVPSNSTSAVTLLLLILHLSLKVGMPYCTISSNPVQICLLILNFVAADHEISLSAPLES